MYKKVEYPEVTPLEDMSKEDILNAIGTAGVVGMGGAGFPTRVKLSPKEPEKIDYIIAWTSAPGRRLTGLSPAII